HHGPARPQGMVATQMARPSTPRARRRRRTPPRLPRRPPPKPRSSRGPDAKSRTGPREGAGLTPAKGRRASTVRSPPLGVPHNATRARGRAPDTVARAPARQPPPPQHLATPELSSPPERGGFL